MDKNTLKLAAAATSVTAVAAFDFVARSKSKKQDAIFSPINQEMIEINQKLMELNGELGQLLKDRSEKMSQLLHMNQYMVGLLAKHNVPVTEFDKIAMMNPITDKK